MTVTLTNGKTRKTLADQLERRQQRAERLMLAIRCFLLALRELNIFGIYSPRRGSGTAPVRAQKAEAVCPVPV